MKFGARICVVVGLATFIIAITTIVEPSEYLFGAEYEVRVINGFTNNSSLPLVIWCSNDEDDIGGRALQEHDDFSWKMKTRFWSNNLMKCTMKYDQTRKKFDAFKASRDAHRCGPFKICTWLVSENGFYFSNDLVNWCKDFEW
ncbi:hypothetical protein K1719_013829 [Acacia pycnantha]|nr:hypothetical protein K1719_039276 [Acacia pycnantha]KAI9114816.1 hypothetical protein K1719_013829 [Acacia pycnantha]